VIVPQTVMSQTITGLLPGRTYTLRVAARDLAGNNSKSSNAVTVTLPGEIPGAPTKPVVQLLGVGPTHVSLTWSSTDNGPTVWSLANRRLVVDLLVAPEDMPARTDKR
jgi:hypothetical protein